MNQLITKEVSFQGANLLAVQNEESGKIHVGVSYICKGIGLTKDQKDRQVKNVQDDIVLRRGCVKFDAGVIDSNNEALAIELDYLPIWLAKISITPKMLKEQPEVANNLIQYQLKAKDVLANAFIKKQTNYSVEDMMIYQLQETKMLKEDVKELKDEMTDFKNDAPLFAVECEQISNAVRKQGVRLLGGKHSKAYEDRTLCNKVYRAIYRELYINFEVTSYKAIKRQYLDKALEIINDTGLPFKLAEEIHAVNTQMSLILKKG